MSQRESEADAASQHPGSEPFDQAAILAAVDHALRESLLGYAGQLPPTLIQMGKMALSAPGKVMHETLLLPVDEGEGGAQITLTPRWPLYVIACYQAAVGREGRDTWKEAMPAAVAVEIAMAAADLLDEIADDDPSPIVRQYGPGQALNTANLMLVMAQQVLLKAARGANGERALDALGALQEMLVDAAMGQHLDMLYDRMGAGEVDLEMSARVTELKAGTLIGGACRMGALMAGADKQVVDLLEKFGRAMGGIAQIINDIQDVLPAEEGSGGSEIERKTDVALHKRTMPIVFTLRDDAPKPNALQRAFSGEAGIDEEEQRRAVIEAGGVQFAQLVMEVHKQNALEAIEELEALRPGAREVLGHLIASE
ncbi:MAG TPA: polyprenyl synthetase family protein [Chloroflexia bacterium]|nr:polyprenyl synthetase family protein [Chloroflexia bacterium]